MPHDQISLLKLKRRSKTSGATKRSVPSVSERRDSGGRREQHTFRLAHLEVRPVAGERVFRRHREPKVTEPQNVVFAEEKVFGLSF